MRRHGRTQRERGGASRSRQTSAIGAKACCGMNLPDGLDAEEELGSPESPHGADFRHGGEFRGDCCDLGTDRGASILFGRGPQQHDSWRHFGPQPQCLACSSALKLDAEWTTSPRTLLPEQSTTLRTRVMPSHRPETRIARSGLEPPKIQSCHGIWPITKT